MDPPWALTQDWAHGGTGSYKFGKLNAGPNEDDQHYPQGLYASLQLPPLRIASTAVSPMLEWWQIANVWGPFFTNGLFTPIDGFVVEIAPSAVGVGDTGSGADNGNRSRLARIQQRYPLSNFRRVSPFEGVYDWETDALNACRALFCRYKHPVFAFQGSPTDSPASPTDPERGVTGTPGTWKQSKIDLSDFRGMEIVVQFSAEVLQDLEVQNGSIGWFVDEVKITGVSNRLAMRVQATNLTVEACGITADFAADDPACFGEDVQFLDRHTGIGLFDTSVTPSVPYPLEYEWIVGGLTLRGFAGELIPASEVGVWGTYDNPRINLRDSAAGISAPGTVSVTLRIYQNGGPPVDTITKSIVYKDAPVPVLNAVSNAYAGGLTQLSATATYNPALDADRTLYWEWDFGDGTGADASGSSVQHVFVANGTYTVSVTVRDEEGCSATDTMTVTVTAAPQFVNPTITAAADPDCGTPFGGDNNADIEELITVALAFQNSAGAANATGVVGYLTSPDENVEIVTGVADFGPVAAPGTAPSRLFRFIRHDDGSGTAPTCLVVPFQLTLVANGGTIVQVLDLAFTMGAATNVFFDNTGTQTGSFTREPDADSGDEVTYSVGPGCLNGLELDIDVTSTGSAVVGDVKIEIISPEPSTHVVQYATGPNDRGPFTVHFRFGASNAFGPIPDLAGQLEEVPPTVLDPTVASTLVQDLVGTSMLGTWTVRVSTTRPGTPATSGYSFTVNEFRLEGTNSADLQVGTPLACGDACFAAGSAPVFTGARLRCPGTVYFTPADDTFTCDGDSDVRYELWASTVAGQLGRRIDGTADEVTSCADAGCADGMCALDNPDGATYWNVCNTDTV
jgi:PKD repeat protein